MRYHMVVKLPPKAKPSAGAALRLSAMAGSLRVAPAHIQQSGRLPVQCCLPTGSTTLEKRRQSERQRLQQLDG